LNEDQENLKQSSSEEMKKSENSNDFSNGSPSSSMPISKIVNEE